MKSLEISAVAVATGIQLYEMYSNYKIKKEKYDIEIIESQKIIKTKQVLLKPKPRPQPQQNIEKETRYFIKINHLPGPPQNSPNKEYCRKCCLRTKYKCNKNKYFACPNNHIWFIRNNRVIFSH